VTNSSITSASHHALICLYITSLLAGEALYMGTDIGCRFSCKGISTRASPFPNWLLILKAELLSQDFFQAGKVLFWYVQA
jgi:hypothetical protein